MVRVAFPPQGASTRTSRTGCDRPTTIGGITPAGEPLEDKQSRSFYTLAFPAQGAQDRRKPREDPGHRQGPAIASTSTTSAASITHAGARRLARGRATAAAGAGIPWTPVPHARAARRGRRRFVLARMERHPCALGRDPRAPASPGAELSHSSCRDRPAPGRRGVGARMALEADAARARRRLPSTSVTRRSTSSPEELRKAALGERARSSGRKQADDPDDRATRTSFPRRHRIDNAELLDEELQLLRLRHVVALRASRSSTRSPFGHALSVDRGRAGRSLADVLAVG